MQFEVQYIFISASSASLLIAKVAILGNDVVLGHCSSVAVHDGIV